MPSAKLPRTRPPPAGKAFSPATLQSLNDRCVNGVRICTWNAGNFLKRYHLILELRNLGVDIVCLQELGPLDHVAIRSLRRMENFKFVRTSYVPRPGGKGGGVAFVVLNPAVRLHVLNRLSRGSMSASVSLDNFEPFILTNSYIPPSGSTYFDDGDTIVEWLVRERLRLCARGFSTFVHAADWNCRQGCEGRFTTDTARATQRFRNITRLLGATPVLGRASGRLSATFTSRGPHSDRRTPEELSEIDGFLTCPKTPLSRLGALQPDSRPQWSNYTENDRDSRGPRLAGDLTHLPVIVDFQPEPRSAAGPAAPRRKSSAPPNSYTPVYADATWAQRADANLRYLSEIAESTSSTSASLEEMFSAICDATSKAAAEVHPWSPHAPTTTYRMFSGSARACPYPFVTAMAEVRRLWRRGKELLQLARHGEVDFAERAALTAQGKALRDKATSIRLHAFKLAENVSRQWRAQLSHALMRARPVDMHGLSQMLRANTHRP